MTRGVADDEDDSPRARPALTHTPRGRDVFAEKLRAMYSAAHDATFSAFTEAERAAARRLEQAIMDEMAALGISLYG